MTVRWHETKKAEWNKMAQRYALLIRTSNGDTFVTPPFPDISAALDRAQQLHMLMGKGTTIEKVRIFEDAK